MTTRIRYLGISAYEVVSPLHRVLLEPFLWGNPVAPVTVDQIERPDVILVSHPAADHMGDAAEIALRTGAPIVCGTDTAAVMRERGVPASQIRTTVWGIQVEVGGVHVRPVECHHWSQTRLADGSVITGTPIGFVFESEPGVRLYHFGDSAIFSDMKLIRDLHHPLVGFLGVSQPKSLLWKFSPGAGRVLTGEMDPEEAALAAEFLGLRYAVATHYVERNDDDVERFLAAVPKHDTSGKRVALALRAGEVLEIDGEDYRVFDPAHEPR